MNVMVSGMFTVKEDTTIATEVSKSPGATLKGEPDAEEDPWYLSDIQKYMYGEVGAGRNGKS